MDSDLRFRLNKNQSRILLLLFVLGAGGWLIVQLIGRNDPTLKARSEAAEAAILAAVKEIQAFNEVTRTPMEGNIRWRFLATEGENAGKEQLSIRVEQFWTARAAKKDFQFRAGSVSSGFRFPEQGIAGEEAIYEDGKGGDSSISVAWLIFRVGPRTVTVSSHRVPFSDIRRIANAIECHVQEITPGGYTLFSKHARHSSAPKIIRMGRPRM